MIPWEKLDTAKIPGSDEELRLMRRGKEFTEPALLAGLWSLLSAHWFLDHYTPQELRRIAQYILPRRVPPARPPNGAV